MAALSFVPRRWPQSAILLGGAGRQETYESRQSSGLHHACIQDRPERREHERFCVQARRARIPFHGRVGNLRKTRRIHARTRSSLRNREFPPSAGRFPPCPLRKGG